MSLRYAFTTAQLRNAILAAQAIKDSPDLLFTGILLACGRLSVFDRSSVSELPSNMRHMKAQAETLALFKQIKKKVK